MTGAPPVQGGLGASDLEAEVDPLATPRPNPPWAGVDLDSVVDAASGRAGIAVTAVGGSGLVRSAGDWQTGVAWSTIKVPLAIAAARVAPHSLEVAVTAITESDNQAAESLWSSLGGGTSAATAVGAVLADAGDQATEVPSVHTRAGYSVFGQTRWSLADQAGFGGRLPCLGSSERVVHLMGQVSTGQRWGLGRIPGARFKGGWGPGESGGYLVRQFGVVPGAGGDVSVAIAVEAPSFEAGTAELTAMANLLAPQLVSVPGGSC